MCRVCTEIKLSTACRACGFRQQYYGIRRLSKQAEARVRACGTSRVLLLQPTPVLSPCVWLQRQRQSSAHTSSVSGAPCIFGPHADEPVDVRVGGNGWLVAQAFHQHARVRLSTMWFCLFTLLNPPAPAPADVGSWVLLGVLFLLRVTQADGTSLHSHNLLGVVSSTGSTCEACGDAIWSLQRDMPSRPLRARGMQQCLSCPR